MNIQVTDLEGSKKDIVIEVPAEVVTEEFNKLYQQFSSNSKLKGFRPGKVPHSILKKLYEPQIKSKVLEVLIPQYYQKALEEAYLEPMDKPQLDKNIDLEEGKPLLIKATLELIPSIEPKEYKDIKFEFPRIEVTDENIENHLKNLQNENAQYEVIENRPVQVEDIVLIEYEGRIEDESKEEIKNNLMVKVKGSDDPNDFTRELIGMNSGDTKQIEFIIQQDFPEKRLIGKRCTANATIREIKEKRLPSLDDEFARDLGEFENLEELKNGIRAEIQADYDLTMNDMVRKRIEDILIERNPIEAPEKMVKLKMKDLIVNILSQLKAQNKLSDNVQIDLPELKENLRPEAIRYVQLSILLEGIARIEGLRATQDEIDDKLKYYAQLAGKDVKTFEEEVKNDGRWLTIRSMISVEKAMQFLLKNIQKDIPESENRIIITDK